MTQLSHSRVVNLLKVSNASVNIVAIRSPVLHRVIATEARGREPSSSVAGAVKLPLPQLVLQHKEEVRDGGKDPKISGKTFSLFFRQWSLVHYRTGPLLIIRFFENTEDQQT